MTSIDRVGILAMQVIDSNSAECSLDNIKLLEELPGEARYEMGKKCEWIKFGPDEIILDNSDEDKHEVFFLVKGNVRIMNFSGADQEIALADLQEGSNFGELSAIDCRGRSARVVGSDNCVVARMERDVFLEMLLRYPKVSLNLLDQLANIIRNLTERVSVLSTLSPHQRVYHELLRISEPDPRGDGTWVIDVVPAHNQIAGWAGTDKMKVANAIGGLVRNGIIKRHHRSLVIIDHVRLKFLADLD